MLVSQTADVINSHLRAHAAVASRLWPHSSGAVNSDPNDFQNRVKSSVMYLALTALSAAIHFISSAVGLRSKGFIMFWLC